MTSLSSAPLPVVAVVGGGASGTLLTLHLLEELRRTGRRAEILLLDRHGRHGRGQAYATSGPQHLLNAPAARRSALEGDPGHFARWAQREAGAAPGDFLPRAAYGRYLVETLAEDAQSAWPHVRLRRLTGEVAGLRAPGRGGASRRAGLRLKDGTWHDADAVVLATGNPPPRPLGTGGGDAVVADPWAPGAIEAVAGCSRVLVVGTGLTMLDVAVTLCGRPGGRASRCTRCRARGCCRGRTRPAHNPSSSRPRRRRRGWGRSCAPYGRRWTPPEESGGPSSTRCVRTCPHCGRTCPRTTSAGSSRCSPGRGRCTGTACRRRRRRAWTNCGHRVACTCTAAAWPGWAGSPGRTRGAPRSQTAAWRARSPLTAWWPPRGPGPRQATHCWPRCSPRAPPGPTTSGSASTRCRTGRCATPPGAFRHGCRRWARRCAGCAGRRRPCRRSATDQAAALAFRLVRALAAEAPGRTREGLPHVQVGASA